MNNTSPSSKIKISQKQKGAASSCRACGTRITFKKLDSGESVAIQVDSSVHRCAQWNSWRSDEG